MAWKEEEGSIIPKVTRPDSFNECRSISCTSIFSKLAETYLLDMLREEVTLKKNQFGGNKGAGTEHHLIELISDQMLCLDDNRACTNLISVDLEKAFNRMDHQTCLKNLASGGASNQTLALAAGFLENRSMRIKLSRSFSSVRRMPGGAPKVQKAGITFFVLPLPP